MRSFSRSVSFRISFHLCLWFCIAACANAWAQAPAAASNAQPAYAAGKIDLMEGDTRVFDKQNARRTVKVGDAVYEGDSIVTGANGEIHMTMDDQGFIAVRPNTKMRITQYRAEGDDQDTGVIALLVGSLRSVTGWIGKYHPKSYSIRTPTATIGIRGTDHEPMVIPEGSADGEAGTYDKVNAGGSFINTAQGKVDVDPNHAGFAPRSGRGTPRVLASVPHFFRPTRNEHLIEGKHEQIQRIVAQRREERRQQIRSGLRPARPALRQSLLQRQQARVQERQNRLQQRREQGPAEAAKREAPGAENARREAKPETKQEPKKENERKRLRRD